MESVKSVGGHVVTVLVTLALVQVWFVDRTPGAAGIDRLPQPPSLCRSRARSSRRPTPTSRSTSGSTRNTNRSVVNITTARLVDRALRRRVDDRRLGLGVRDRPRGAHPHELPRHRRAPTPSR